MPGRGTPPPPPSGPRAPNKLHPLGHWKHRLRPTSPRPTATPCPAAPVRSGPDRLLPQPQPRPPPASLRASGPAAPSPAGCRRPASPLPPGAPGPRFHDGNRRAAWRPASRHRGLGGAHGAGPARGPPPRPRGDLDGTFFGPHVPAEPACSSTCVARGAVPAAARGCARGCEGPCPRDMRSLPLRARRRRKGRRGSVSVVA